MRYAKFQHPKFEWNKGIYDEDIARYTDLVRVSEWVEVDFPPLPGAVLVPHQIAALEKEVEKITTAMAKERTALEAAKAKLIAIQESA